MSLSQIKKSIERNKGSKVTNEEEDQIGQLIYLYGEKFTSLVIKINKFSKIEDIFNLLVQMCGLPPKGIQKNLSIFQEIKPLQRKIKEIKAMELARLWKATRPFSEEEIKKQSYMNPHILWKKLFKKSPSKHDRIFIRKTCDFFGNDLLNCCLLHFCENEYELSENYDSIITWMEYAARSDWGKLMDFDFKMGLRITDFSKVPYPSNRYAERYINARFNSGGYFSDYESYKIWSIVSRIGINEFVYCANYINDWDECELIEKYNDFFKSSFTINDFYQQEENQEHEYKGESEYHQPGWRKLSTNDYYYDYSMADPENDDGY